NAGRTRSGTGSPMRAVGDACSSSVLVRDNRQPIAQDVHRELLKAPLAMDMGRGFCSDELDLCDWRVAVPRDRPATSTVRLEGRKASGAPATCRRPRGSEDACPAQ